MPPPPMDGISWYILNQTAPLPSNVAAVIPAGTLAMYADKAPGWKMLGLADQVTLPPALALYIEVLPPPPRMAW